jgi:hypothetical protein
MCRAAGLQPPVNMIMTCEQCLRGPYLETCQIRGLHALSVATRVSVSNDGDALPRVRIENDVLGEDEVLSHVPCLEGGAKSPARNDRAAALKTRS